MKAILSFVGFMSVTALIMIIGYGFGTQHMTGELVLFIIAYLAGHAVVRLIRKYVVYAGGAVKCSFCKKRFNPARIRENFSSRAIRRNDKFCSPACAMRSFGRAASATAAAAATAATTAKRRQQQAAAGAKLRETMNITQKSRQYGQTEALKEKFVKQCEEEGLSMPPAPDKPVKTYEKQTHHDLEVGCDCDLCKGVISVLDNDEGFKVTHARTAGLTASELAHVRKVWNEIQAFEQQPEPPGAGEAVFTGHDAGREQGDTGAEHEIDDAGFIVSRPEDFKDDEDQTHDPACRCDVCSDVADRKARHEHHIEEDRLALEAEAMTEPEHQHEGGNCICMCDACRGIEPEPERSADDNGKEVQI